VGGYTLRQGVSVLTCWPVVGGPHERIDCNVPVTVDMLSVADIALFPHLASAKAMGVEFSMEAYSHLARWFKRMRALPICAADLRAADEFPVGEFLVERVVDIAKVGPRRFQQTLRHLVRPLGPFPI
jgi:hypothetical protein